MSTFKIIAIISLLLIGFHLFLYGYVKRRIAATKRLGERLKARDIEDNGD